MDLYPKLLTDLPQTRGYIDRMERAEAGQLLVAGWALSPEGIFDGFKVLTDFGEFDARSHYRANLSRPALQKVFPAIEKADQAGFDFRLPLDGVDLREPNVLSYTVIAERDGAPVAQIPSGYLQLSTEWSAPPSDLMNRVSNTRDERAFFSSGMKTAVNFVSYVRKHRDIQSLDNLLDWGCGSGRLTPHLLHCLPSTSVHGSDIDGEAVSFAAGKYPRATLSKSPPAPPLPYDNGQFDVILAGSVFTHLTKELQVEWLHELKRVLNKGGLLLASTHGEHAAFWSTGDESAAIKADGFVDTKLDKVLDGIAPPNYYRATFQSRDYTQRVWGDILDIIDHIPAGYANYQDIFILRKD